METHKIDQLFKQKLTRHSEKVSSDAFAKMQAQMKGKKQKKGFPWMIAASVSILITLTFGGVYNYNKQGQEGLSQIDLNDQQFSFTNDMLAEFPETKEILPANKLADEEKKRQNNAENIQPLSKPEIKEYSRMASMERLDSYEADINSDFIPELRLSPAKHENKVVVEMHYAYADIKKEENLIVKSNKKLKSLASEFSLAELRSAKNELFASAFQFNKKENN